MSEQINEIAIYGAQMVAVSVYYAIKELYSDCRVKCFIVSNKAGNPAAVDGIPVIDLEEFNEKDMVILIATPENYHKEIVREMLKKGLCRYVCIDSLKEASLMEQYYNKKGKFCTLHSLDYGNKKAEISAFLSVSHKDKPLSRDYKKKEWMQYIQAGAALTELRNADICDNIGDNVSGKNANYCELSAMYWIWKHIKSEYAGLFHYRRQLDIQEEDFFRIKSNDIDVILPYPTIHYPNIQEHHKRYLSDEDWNVLLYVLKNYAPDYAEAFNDIFGKQYFYNYNMLIAKKSVFDDYCSWLFPLLERIEELSKPKGNERADRYIGYLGENLTTLYFMFNQSKLKIAHTGRILLI